MLFQTVHLIFNGLDSDKMVALLIHWRENPKCHLAMGQIECFKYYSCISHCCNKNTQWKPLKGSLTQADGLRGEQPVMVW